MRDGNRENCVVHLVDTGLRTQTGGPAKKGTRFVGDETFVPAYGDGVASVDISFAWLPPLLWPAGHRDGG